MNNLFDDMEMGALHLPNRMVMAPLTRRRAPENIANDLMAAYYVQRATAGLIISEGSQISPLGVGYPATPGIHSQAQVDGWKKVTSAVHEAKGRIFLQLWHVGRISHPDYHNGELPVAPSAIAPAGEAVTSSGMKPFVTPRELETGEISDIVDQFKQAAVNARAAGFDGVEIHGANGYLIDQFIRDGTNHRRDSYGGGVENRTRLCIEVIDAVVGVWGCDRVGIRLSPSGTLNDISDSNPTATFVYLAERLSRFKLAYLHVVDALEGDIRHGARVVALADIRKAYDGTLIVCGGYDKERGNAAIADGLADCVAFGKLFIANPDLVKRFETDAALNAPDVSGFYDGGEKGYTDYPALNRD